MPTRFAQIFKRTGVANLLRQFGEWIVYLPRAGGKPRRIFARVVRNDPSIISETGEVVGQNITITVENSVTTGILATEIDSGGDEVQVAIEEGGELVTRSIAKVLNDSNGQVNFLVQ